MFAIANITGKQFRLEKGIKVETDRVLNVEAGSSFEIRDILMFSKNSEVALNPKNVTVKARLLANYRDDKIIVFKKKRRKGYKKKRGHRQEKTLFVVEDIIVS